MKIRDSLIVVIFFLVICSSMILGMINSGSKEEITIELNGYSDEVEKPKFSFSDFFAGKFQSDYTAWYDNEMPIKGFWVKNYATFNYALFREANNPIGKDDYIYDDNYLRAVLAFGEEDDFSSQAMQQQITDFVDKIALLNEMLNERGKKLLVYTVPSKVQMEYDKIPYSYKLFEDENKVSVVDVFDAEMKKTQVPYVDCKEYENQVEYPLYYSTGIHWSRPYEQYASSKIIEKMGEITGNSYQNFYFDGVEVSKEDFYRDSDLYDLMNVWNKSDCDFYQMKTMPVVPKDPDYLRMFIYGDSFAQGLRKDILDNYIDAVIYYVNRDEYLEDSASMWGNYTMLEGDYENLDTARCLANSDIVVLEFVDAELKYLSNGFVDHLINYLAENEIPDSKEYGVKRLDMNDRGQLRDNVFGIYEIEEDHGYYSWIKGKFEAILDNEEIYEKGLRMSYAIVPQTEGNTVYLYINDELKATKQYDSYCDDSILIPAEELKREPGKKMEIRVELEKTFNAGEATNFVDKRDLGIKLIYLGEQ